MPVRRHARARWLLLALAASAAPVRAQDATPAAEAFPDTIVVTAQRRAEPIIETPLAISSQDGGFIERANLQSVRDLVTFAPGFSGAGSSSFIDDIAVRGIVSTDYGVGGDSALGVFKDGVYQGRVGSVVTSLFDIDRAELLRGPQSFLFGRNAIAGAISIITAKPLLNRIGGHAYIGYGARDRLEGEAAFNLPLGDHWAARFAGYALRSDGWVDNAFTPGTNDRLAGENKTAGRASLLYDNGATKFTITGEYEHHRQSSALYRGSNRDREIIDGIDAALDTDLVVRGGPRDIDSDLLDPFDKGRIYSVNAQADFDLGFATLTTISAWRGYRFDYLEDYDGTPLLIGNYGQAQRGHDISQEVRLVSPGGARFNWLVGASAYREKLRARFTNEIDENIACVAGFGYADCDELTQDLYGTAYVPAPDGALMEINDVRGRNDGISLYAQGDYAVAPRLRVGAGVRYTIDRKRFAMNVPLPESSLGSIWNFGFFTDGFIQTTKTWRGVTPRLSIAYDAGRVKLYATATRGYKAGGFGSFTVAPPSPIEEFGQVPDGTIPDAFRPETLWSYEIGAKGSLFGRRMTFAVTAFDYRYKDLQSSYFDADTRTRRVINIGRVHGRGIETEATFRPNRYFDVYANLVYTRTVKRGDRDCALNDCGGLPSPIWASSGIATVHNPIGDAELYLSGEWSYRGAGRETFDWRGITRRAGYVVLNARLGWRSDAGWDVSGYIQNLTDRTYYTNVMDGGDLTPAAVISVLQPRNAGVQLRRTF